MLPPSTPVRGTIKFSGALDLLLFFFCCCYHCVALISDIILPHPAATDIRDDCCLFVVYCCSDCLCRFLFLALFLLCNSYIVSVFCFAIILL